MKNFPLTVTARTSSKAMRYKRPIKLIAGLRLLALFCILASQLACTATTIPPYEATYTTKLRGIKITGIRKFEITGENTYKISWKAKALWMRLNEWSEFEIINNRTIRPLSYHYTRKGLGTDRPVHIYFDWKNGIANGSKGKKEYQFDLPSGTLDRLSYQFQLQMDLLEKPRKKSFSYNVASHNKIKIYTFDFQGNETISTNLGLIDSLIYRRQKENRTTNIWFSPAQHYLPVQIEQIERGKSSTIKIKNWKSNDIIKHPKTVNISSLNKSFSKSTETTVVGFSESSGESSNEDEF